MCLILIYGIMKPSVFVDKSNFDYGEISRKKINIGNVIIENKGIFDLKIKNIESCCGLKVYLDNKKILKRGEKQKISFIYNSSEVSYGRFNKTITINTNDFVKKSIVIPVTGVVIEKKEKLSEF